MVSSQALNLQHALYSTEPPTQSTHSGRGKHFKETNKGTKRKKARLGFQEQAGKRRVLQTSIGVSSRHFFFQARFRRPSYQRGFGYTPATERACCKARAFEIIRTCCQDENFWRNLVSRQHVQKFACHTMCFQWGSVLYSLVLWGSSNYRVKCTA